MITNLLNDDYKFILKGVWSSH